MTVYVDTSVIMYAGGRDHPLRRPCREVIRQVVAGDLDGVTSAEVVQEILHRFASSPQREKGIAMARATLDLFDHLLPVDRTMISAAVDLHEQYEDLSARDALHAADGGVQPALLSLGARDPHERDDEGGERKLHRVSCNRDRIVLGDRSGGVGGDRDRRRDRRHDREVEQEHVSCQQLDAELRHQRPHQHGGQNVGRRRRHAAPEHDAAARGHGTHGRGAARSGARCSARADSFSQ
jgi:uncharacterized protein